MKFLFTSLLLIPIIIQLSAQNVSTLVTKPGARFEAITWAPDNRIFVVDFNSGEVFKLSTEGALTNIGTYSGALGGAFDAAGNFYFSRCNGQGLVMKVDPMDNVTTYANGFSCPTGILIDEDKQLMYVSNYNNKRILSVDMTASDPAPITFATDALINGPDGLLFAPDGDIISANFNNNTVQKITPEGNVSLFATLEGSSNSGYLVRQGPGYLITGANGNDLFSMSLDGEVTKFAGTGAAGDMDGPLAEASFEFPNGIALSPTGDSLLIAESHTGGVIRLITGLNDSITQVTSIPQVQFNLYPNPADEFININFELAEKANLSIELLTIDGQHLDTLWQGQHIAGWVNEQFPLQADLPVGNYLLQIKVGQRTYLEKVGIK